MLVALLLTSVGRYLLVPQLWDRYHGAVFVLVPLLVLSMASAALPARGDAPQSESASSPT